MVGVELDKITKSLSYLIRIKEEFPESEEANYVDVQIAKLKTLLQ